MGDFQKQRADTQWLGRRRLPRTLLCAGGFFLSSLAYALPNPTDLTLTDMGTPGGTTSFGWDINAGGRAVGFGDDGSGRSVAFTWTTTDGLQALPDLGGNASAYSVNDFNVSTGAIATTSGAVSVARWQNGTLTDLGTFGGDQAIGYGINNMGQIVGGVITEGIWQAYIWIPASGATFLGDFGGSGSIAFGINDASEVVGFARTAAGEWHAFHWNGTMIDLNPSGSTYSLANDIGDDGAISGSALINGQYQAFGWTGSGATQVPFGAAVGGFAACYGVGRGAEYVGTWSNGSTISAFVGDTTGTRVTLPSLGGMYSEAEGANTLGTMVGWSLTGLSPHAVVWTTSTANPVPCTTECNPTCSADCAVECPTGGTCSPTCRGGSTCTIGCEEAQSCTVDCRNGSSCNVDCTDAQSCTPTCRQGADCILGCANADTCNVECKQNGDCIVDCSSVNDCDLSCIQGDSCFLNCTGAEDCGVACEQGVDCTVDCTNADSCSAFCGQEAGCSINCTGAENCEVTCRQGSTCVLDCTGSTSCGFSACQGGEASCPGDIIVCNQGCP